MAGQKINDPVVKSIVGRLGMARRWRNYNAEHEALLELREYHLTSTVGTDAARRRALARIDRQLEYLATIPEDQRSRD